MSKSIKSTRLNINSVASAAGVSKTTVSHVVSGNRPVSEETRARVQKVIAELGFQPNYFAQALNSSTSRSVALVVQDITNSFYPALARGVQSVMASSNQVLMLFDAGARDNAIDAFVADVIQRRVDGVIVAAGGIEAQIRALVNAGVAVVTVGSEVSTLPLDWASADDVAIGITAVEFLYSRGHTRIATIGGSFAYEPGRGRHKGYAQAMDRLGLARNPLWEVESDFSRQGGAAATHALLGLADPPTAVFCANDLMAIGALDAAREANLVVPDDIAIMGVDDIEAASLVSPSLSTVRVPAEEIGRFAGELLLGRINGGSPDAQHHVLVKHSLVPRQSA